MMTETKVREAIAAVSLATGETREDHLVEMIEQALAEPGSLYEQDTAVSLAKAALAGGPVPTLAGGGGLALEWARDAVAREELAKSAGVPVHPERMRSLHSTIDALEVLRDVQPTAIGRRPDINVNRAGAVFEGLGFRVRPEFAAPPPPA